MAYWHLEGVLDPAALTALREQLEEGACFADGGDTATGHARSVKANEQALPNSTVTAVTRLLADRLGRHPVFASTRPARLVGLRISRYRPGMRYGLHVDEAIIDGARSDLSFTCFLSHPDEYEGGALRVLAPGGEHHVRLPAGDVFLYPAGTLHEVEPVVAGTRLAIVGWCQSRLRNTEQRTLIMELDGVLASLEGVTDSGMARPALLRIRGELLRMWLDP